MKDYNLETDEFRLLGKDRFETRSFRALDFRIRDGE